MGCGGAMLAWHLTGCQMGGPSSADVSQMHRVPASEAEVAPVDALAGAVVIQRQGERKATLTAARQGNLIEPFQPSDLAPQPDKVEAGGPAVFPLYTYGGALAIDSDVRIPRLDVQPLENGFFRVWVRIYNDSDRLLRLNIDCELNAQENTTPGYTYREVELPARQFRDFSFELPGEEVQRFVVLVQESGQQRTPRLATF